MTMAPIQRCTCGYALDLGNVYFFMTNHSWGCWTHIILEKLRSAKLNKTRIYNCKRQSGMHSHLFTHKTPRPDIEPPTLRFGISAESAMRYSHCLHSLSAEIEKQNAFCVLFRIPFFRQGPLTMI